MVAYFDSEQVPPPPSNVSEMPAFLQTGLSWSVDFILHCLSSCDALELSILSSILLRWQLRQSETLVLGFLQSAMI